MESCEKSMSAELQNTDEILNPTVDNAAETDANESGKQTEAVNNYSSMSKSELIDTLTELVEKPVDEVKDNVNAVKHAFYALRKVELEKEMADFIERGNEAAAFVPMPDDAEEKLKELLTKYKEKKAEQLAAHEAELQANLLKKREVIAKLSELANDSDNINKHYQEFQQLQSDFKSIGNVPPSDDKTLWKDYQSVTEQFYDLWKINKELRDYDFKKNLEAKQLLCEEAEKLDGESDIIAAFKRLQELHDKWREIGPVVKELREDLWKRFKDASTVINKKHQAFFEDRKEKEKENETAKTEICEEVEKIDYSTFDTYAKWNDATKQIIALQERWKTLGFAARKVNNELFVRFRKTCDDFFTNKAAFFKKMKDESAENLAKKQKLCERAEALKDSTDWKKTADELVELQKEWKKIGPVAKRSGDSVWKRFISACDCFFENKNKNSSNLRQEKHDNLKAKKEIIEKIKTIDESLSKDEVKTLLKSLSAEYQGIGHVPYKEKDKVYEEYKKALNEAYKKFDVDESRSRFENYVNNVEEIASDKNKLFRERERLVRQYEQKSNEVKTYENNLGFFNVTSKSGGSVLKEMERRILKAKEELAVLEKKIELIDEKI